MVRDTAMHPVRVGNALFGDTDIAGGIPDAFRPQASSGPVFFEGKLIVALSFQDAQALDGDLSGGETLQGIMQLWDCLGEAWLDDGPMLMRYDCHDVVLVDGAPVWRGILDTRYDARLVPGWDSACAAINGSCYLRWKQRCGDIDCSDVVFR